MLPFLLSLLLSAGHAEPIFLDDQVLCCQAELTPLPAPDIATRPVALPAPDRLPPGLQAARQARDDAEARLRAWEALRSAPLGDLLAQVESLGPTTTTPRAYRRALRRDAPSLIRSLLDDEIAAQQASAQRAASVYAEALQAPQPEPAVELWRRLLLSDRYPEQRAAHAQWLRAAHPGGPHRDRILYLSGTSLPEHGADLALLIEQHPDSVLAPSARLHLARAALLRGDPVAAARHAAPADAPEAQVLRAQALLALGDVEEALQSLSAPTGAPSPERDATTARALLEVSWQQEQRALSLAEARGLARPGVLAPLADDLDERGRWDEGIDVLDALLHAGMLADAPQRHLQLARMHERLEDRERQAQAWQEITERYGPDSEWATAFRSDSETLEAGRAVWEGVVRSRAMDWHARAQMSGDADAYARAAAGYQRLGAGTPQEQWILADALIGSGQDDAARAVLESLIAAAGGYTTAARHRLVALYQQGAERSPEEVRRLLAVIDALGEPGPPPAEDVAGYTEEAAVLALLAATICEEHGLHDEARARLLRILVAHPERPEARDAAHRLLQAGEVDAVVAWGTRAAATPDDAALIEQASFLRAQQLASSGEPDALRAAADAFLVFVDHFPGSEHAASALYRAGIHRERAGDAESAGELFAEFATRYPDDERSPPLMFRVASDHTRRLELARAIDWYRRLETLSPEAYPDVGSAVYNSGMLHAALGQHQEAAAAWERYAVRFPDAPDAEAVFFAAGQQHLRVGDAEAIDFFERYLRIYPRTDPDHVIEAHHQICRLRGEVVCPELLRAYDAHEAVAGPQARHLAAMAAFSAFATDTEARGSDAWRKEGMELIARFRDQDCTNAVLYSISIVNIEAWRRPQGEVRLEQELAMPSPTGRASSRAARAQSLLGVPLETLPIFSAPVDEEEAWAAARERLRQDRDDVGAVAELGAHYLATGDPQRAVWIVQLVPQQLDALLAAVRGEASRQQGQHARAHAALEGAPNRDAVQAVRGMLLLDARDWARALAALEGVPGAPGAVMRGIALHRLGRLQEAEAEYRAAAEAAPDAAAPHYNLAVLYGQQGREKEAARAIQESSLRRR